MYMYMCEYIYFFKFSNFGKGFKEGGRQAICKTIGLRSPLCYILLMVLPSVFHLFQSTTLLIPLQKAINNNNK